MSIVLSSRGIRQTTKGRKINLGKTVGGVIGFLKPLFNLVGGLVSWAFSFLQISLVSIFSAIYQGTIFLLNFDWNQSDQQLAQAIESNNLQVASQAGTLVGGAAAWLVCIGGAAALEAKLPILRGRLVAELAKSGGANVGASLRSFLTSAGTNAASNAVISSFRDVRRWLLTDTGLGNRVGNFLFGSNYPEVKKKWGKSSEPWIISEKIEDGVQSISNAGLRVFTESLIEEFGDELTECLFEAVYIIQRAYDDDIAVQDYAYGYDYNSPEIAVDVTPDRTSIVPLRSSNEIIRVTAPNPLILKERINAVLTTAKVLDNRDVGIVIGEPAEDRVTTNPLSRQLVLTFRGQPKPPFKNNDGFPTRSVTVTIPEPKRGLSWTVLKTLTKPYTWGKFMAIAQLTQGRKLKVFSASPGEAENKAREFASFSTLEVLSISVTEEGFKRNQALIKKPERIYPQYATLTVRRDNLGLGRNFADGRTLSQEIQQVVLWTDTEPPNTPVLF